MKNQSDIVRYNWHLSTYSWLQVIAERRKILKETRTSTSDEVDHQKQVKPFLDYMLLESNFTDEEIENEVQTFMFAVSTRM